MSLPAAVTDHYRGQQRRFLQVLGVVHAAWGRMGEDFDASWPTVSLLLAAAVSNGQRTAARDGATYVPIALREQGIRVEPVGEADPDSFTGAWPLGDSRVGDLDGLLYGAVIKAKTASVDSTSARLAVGRSWLDMIVQTQLADAARQAAGVTIAATPRTGWVRMVNPPCCQRCAVLAGRFYRWSSGFQRHPRCDCRHVPTTEANYGKVAQRIGPGDVKDLTEAQRSAIADGADMNQVINAYRGQSVRSLATTEGTTKRGTARAAMRAAGTRGPRLTPEAIYRIATTREQAVDLLKAYGYLL